MEAKRITSTFKSGYPQVEEPSPYPEVMKSPPQKLETRTPMFWIANTGKEQFFVNESDEILYYVDAGTGGWMTSDEEVITVNSVRPKYYENVLPGEAVKIDDYDENDLANIMYGSDFVTSLCLDLKSPKLGEVCLQTLPSSDGAPEGVLMWNDGNLAKHIRIISSDHE